MKIPFTKSAIAKFREREKEIDALSMRLVGLQKLAEHVEPEIKAAHEAYLADSGSEEKARAWEDAVRRVSPGPGGSRFNVAEWLLSGERQIVQAKQDEARRSAEYVALLARALAEHNEAIHTAYETKRSSWLESLKASGETNVNVDQMPSLRGLLERIDRNKDTIILMQNHPDNAARNMHIGNALAFLNKPVDYVAPPPPAARPMQGFVPGGNMPVGHALAHPTNPVADTKVETVPAEVDQGIRAKLVREQNEHFERQQAQVLAELARQADLAKERQAETVGI